MNIGAQQWITQTGYRVRLALMIVLMLLVGPALSAPQNSLQIQTQAGETYRFEVELADTPSMRSQGLMHRKHLAPDSGMLFYFESNRRVSMWMKETYIPLDMLFIDESGLITHLAERTKPLSLDFIDSPRPVRGVLELQGGTAARYGIGVGDRVIHSLF